jgi:uncharacterized protein
LEIHALNIYPVKALGGFSLRRALLTSKGLAITLGEHYLFDRQWMLINAQQQMITQRQLPGLARLQPELIGDALCLSAQGHDAITLALAPSDAPEITCLVWRTPVQVQVCSDAINQWLNRVFPGENLQLVSLACERPTLLKRFGPQSSTHFADAAPYLVANTASLAALNTALAQENLGLMDARRFRANIWLDGLAPFAEHQLTSLGQAAWQLRLVDHCQRCSVITVDPDLGTFTPNAVPINTLARLNPMPNQPRAPAFGVNAVYECDEACWVEVGDRF